MSTREKVWGTNTDDLLQQGANNRGPLHYVIRCLIKIGFEIVCKGRCLIETGFRHRSNLGLNLVICEAPSHLAMEMGGFFNHILSMGGTREFVRHLFKWSELNGYGYYCSVIKRSFNTVGLWIIMMQAPVKWCWPGTYWYKFKIKCNGLH